MKHRLVTTRLLGWLVAAACFAAPAVPAAAAELAAAPAQDRCDDVATFTTVLVSGDLADVYHPQPARGTSPVIAFLQGGLVDKSLYAGFARELAGAGYIVVVPNHYLALVPNQPPQLFASQQVINDVLATMVAAHANPASPVYGAVDTANLGVSGHSFGGAAALFAIDGRCMVPFCFGFYARPPQLKAAAVYGVNTYSQAGVLLDVNTSAVPVAMLHGSVDGRATVARALATFGILEKPKAYIGFEGLNHWGIADAENPPGNPPDPNVQTRPREWGIAKTAKWARIVFDAYLKRDAGALRMLRGERGESGVTIDFVE